MLCTNICVEFIFKMLICIITKLFPPGIRRLQAILLKCALIFGAKLYTGVTFEHVIEPNSPEEGWKSKLSPDNHPLNTFEFDVLIGADGKKNVLPGFQQIEMRGTLTLRVLFL